VRVQQPERDTRSCGVAGDYFDLPRARFCFLEPTSVQRSFGEIADEPARDDRMACRARRIEEPFCEFVGVGVPARPERSEDPTDLREGDRDVRPVGTAMRSACAAARSAASSTPQRAIRTLIPRRVR
jgi:hypothetical protein